MGAEESLSQFQRAMKELGVEVIHASSPQGKGRVERLFKTLQDRLVKELRLHGVSTLKEANEFLAGYWPKFNDRFGVEPAKERNLHQAITKAELDSALCIKEPRRVRNDCTISHNGKCYQLLQPTTARWVTVEQRMNGRMLVTSGGKALRYQTLQSRPVRKADPGKLHMSSRKTRPPEDHPWKRYNPGWLKRRPAPAIG